MEFKLYDYDLLVTKEQFLEATGLNLSYELKKDDDAENKVKRFLNRTQQFLIDYTKNIKFEESDLDYIFDEDNWADEDIKMNTEKLNNFARAVLHQAEYILKNGERHIFNGFIGSSNLMVDFKSVLLAPLAEQNLREGCFLNIRTGKGDNERYVPELEEIN